MNALKSPLARIMRVAVLGLVAFVVLMPYLFMLTTSLKPQADIFSASLHLWPEHTAILDNFTRAFTRVPMAQNLLNGMIVCSLILFFQVLFALPAAYALARLKFRGAGVVFGCVILGLLVPIQAISVPLYAAARAAGLLNTLAILVIPFTLSVFAIFQFRQVIRAFPQELIEAARLDGMGEFAICWRVVLPNIWPTATAFAIFSVVAHWNDLYWPLVVISRSSLATPPLGLLFFHDADAGDDFGALMAATVVVTAPLIVFFLFAQKAFIEGLTTSGLKG